MTCHSVHRHEERGVKQVIDRQWHLIFTVKVWKFIKCNINNSGVCELYCMCHMWMG